MPEEPGGSVGGIKLPTEEDLKNLPNDERLRQAAEVAGQAASAEGLVNSLKKKAAAITNPKERERILTEAYNNEVKAKGLSKKAKILQSGGFQGVVAGGGIGAATGVGLGTAVGTLVGTAATIPTTLVGGLVGGGVGLFHGPWIKFGGKDGKEEVVQVPQESIDNGAVLVDDKTGNVTVKDPAALKDAAAAAEQAAKVSAAAQKDHQPEEKRKPKKLEIRSNKQGGAADKAAPSPPTANGDKGKKKKPKKLEVRSKSSTPAS